MSITLVHADANDYIKTLADSSVQCCICDPPFGLGEDAFDAHYARDDTHVLEGYATAPTSAQSYETWASAWIHQIPRILKPDGTLYLVCAWNHLCDIELAIRSAPAPGLTVVNHIIWKYNFGVYTQKKFVTSHYHILRCSLRGAKPAFNSRAYFSEKDKTADGHSAQYGDMEDVWVIPKEFKQGETKNINKLPDALVRKLILYSSKPGDLVADFFLGNFTTAYVAKKEGRAFTGCEVNKTAFDHHEPLVKAAPTLITPEAVSTKPEHAGKKLTDEERGKICIRYAVLHATKTKKDSMAILETEFGRGHFSLLNILKHAGY
jgi:site-specific DNA-methyltransferase (adenine-specific)